MPPLDPHKTKPPRAPAAHETHPEKQHPAYILLLPANILLRVAQCMHRHMPHAPGYAPTCRECTWDHSGTTQRRHRGCARATPGTCTITDPWWMLDGCLVDPWWILRYACPPSYVCGSVPVLCADWLGMGRHTYDDEERCCFLYVLLLHVVLCFLVALRFQQLYSRSFKTGTWRFQQLYSRYGKNWQLVVSPFAC